jgi:hypothetical protein
MATAATKTKSRLIPDYEAAEERFRETSDRIVDANTKLVGAYLDGVERYVSSLAALERKLGQQTKIDAFSTLTEAHANVVEDVTKASVTAARELVATAS